MGWHSRRRIATQAPWAGLLRVCCEELRQVTKGGSAVLTHPWAQTDRVGVATALLSWVR